MKAAISSHDRIIGEAVQAHGGVRPGEQGEGDSTLSAFKKPSDALACVLAIQRAFIAEPWPEPVVIRMRAALHTGEVELRDESRYWGSTINRCARLRSIAHGGQTLVSRITHDLVADRLPSDVTLRDMGSHHLRDLSTPEHVFQLCHPELPADFSPLLSLEAFPNNLPLQLKSFVPREKEMEEVQRRLGSSRLLTLTGAGGSGKTRLALQTAADSLEQYQGGVWLVDFAPITDPKLVAETVAKAVRAPVLGGTASQDDPRSVLERVIDYLRVRKALLILDNCEHLLDASSEIVEALVQSCPDLTLLVTSREPLGVDGESVWRIPSMSVPGLKEGSDPERLATYQAVSLFVERASAVKEDFVINSENAAAIAEITRRFDGIPLAVELAAARVNVLSPMQIASMLDDQFRLLAGGSRKALERQQTMRACIDWSYKHVSDPEKVLIRRLSVFAGGATIEAVEQVCSGEELKAYEILDLLSHLVQKSLLETYDSKGRVRYRFLEMIRQYAREILNDSGESASIRTRHRDFYMQFVEEAELGMRQGDETPWLESIDIDHDNIRSAFEWSIDSGEKESALRIASNLWWYWWQRTMRDEGWSWLEQALDLEGDVSDEVMGRVGLAKGYAATLSGHSQDERRLWDEMAVEAFDRFSSEPSALKALALLLQAMDTLPRRWELFERGASEARRLGETGDNWALAIGLGIEGFAARVKGDLAASLSLLEEGYALARRTGNVHLSVDFATHWGMIDAAMTIKDYERARRYAEDVLDFWRERAIEIKIAYSLKQLGYVSLRQNRTDEARNEIKESFDIIKRLGDARDIANVTHSLGEVEEAAGNSELAHVLFSDALDMSRRTHNTRTACECLWGLSRLARADPEQALVLLGEAVRLQEDSQWSSAWVRRLAQVLVDAGRYEDAVRIFGGYYAHGKGLWMPISPEESDRYEEALGTAREALDEKVFSTLWDEGMKMQYSAVVELALKAAQAK